MGWKTSMIIINSEQRFDKNELFDSLGYYELKKEEDQYFESIMNPEDGKIYLGNYNGNLIICMQNLPLDSMNKSLSKAETVLSNQFQDTDIVSFVLHSVVNLWGYSLVKNGEKIRVRAGSSEGGTMIEYGDVLEEEKELFSISKVKDNGKRVFVYDGMPDDEFLDDQVGENFVFDISCKYLGEDMDACDGLFKTKFEGYSFSKVKPEVEVEIKPEAKIETLVTVVQEGANERIIAPEVPVLETPDQRIPPKGVKPKKPWWKFW